MDYWQKSSLIGDCFGGVATGGIIAAYHGLRWVGVELESRFVALGNENIDMHRAAWATAGDPVPLLIQGDSRNFAALVAGCDAIASSPPYGESTGVPSLGTVNREDWQNRNGGDIVKRRGLTGEYGSTDGQIGLLKSGDVDSVISSPPYADSLSPSAGIDRERRHEIAKRLGKKIEEVTPADIGEAAEQDSYGKTPGQIGSLEQGQISAVASSPPFSVDQPCASQTQALKDYHAFTRGDGSKRDQVMVSDGNIQACPTGSLDSVITSPPYSNSLTDRNGIDLTKLACGSHGPNTQAKAAGYGESEGQIGNLSCQHLSAIVSSPPYAESIQGDHSERETAAESQAKRVTTGGSLGQSQRNGGYGATEGNIGNLKEGELDAVATSPPFENQLASHDNFVAPHDTGKRMATDYNTAYGASEGQIGKEVKETYWKAVSLVYQQMHIALKPSGVAVLVVKNYVSKGKIVDLIGQTIILLEHLGFDVFEETRCSLVKEKHYHSLFEDEQVITTKTERKSFFKRLAESKGSPKIDYESVIWCRKRELNAASVGRMDSGS